MNNKEHMRELIRQAEELMGLFKRLDYRAILEHEPEAVAALQGAVQALKKTLPAGGESLGSYARRQTIAAKAARGTETVSAAPGAKPEAGADNKAALQERRRRFVEALSHAGLGERLGKLYSTVDARRLLAFREAPHTRGLPQFDMLVGPDFAPTSGYHGIFISPQEVMSCILPVPADAHQWQLRERHRFTSMEQMVDLVSMLSAGFPVGE